MRATAKEIIRSLQEALEEQGLNVHSIIDSRTANSVDVTTLDAHPQDQGAVREICQTYRLGNSYLTLESYEYDNIRDDLPQTEYLHCFHRMTPGLHQRLSEFAERESPSGNNPYANTLLAQMLFGGQLPGFWTQETGKTQAPRCCVCQKPVEDTTQAHSRRFRQARVYRHRQCGDFQPTPRQNER